MKRGRIAFAVILAVGAIARVVDESRAEYETIAVEGARGVRVR